VQIRLFDRAQYATLDITQILMESIYEQDESCRRRNGNIPEEKKILFEKGIELSVDDQRWSSVTHWVAGAPLVKDRGGFIKRKKEVGKRNIF
jgi:hypothetical protein